MCVCVYIYITFIQTYREGVSSLGLLTSDAPSQINLRPNGTRYKKKEEEEQNLMRNEEQQQQ